MESVAASCDPAWASQTEIGNKNDTLEEAVFRCQDQIFNSPDLLIRCAGLAPQRRRRLQCSRFGRRDGVLAAEQKFFCFRFPV